MRRGKQIKKVKLYDGFDYDVYLSFSENYTHEGKTVFITFKNEEIDNWYGRRMDVAKDLNDEEFSSVINQEIKEFVKFIEKEKY